MLTATHARTKFRDAPRAEPDIAVGHSANGHSVVGDSGSGGSDVVRAPGARGSKLGAPYVIAVWWRGWGVGVNVFASLPWIHSAFDCVRCLVTLDGHSDGGGVVDKAVDSSTFAC